MKKFLAAVMLLLLVLTGCTSSAQNPTSPASTAPRQPASYLSVHFIDVDQADSALLVTGDTAVLIDAGRIESGRDVLAYIKDHNIRDLDLVVSTHPHGDHLGGIPTVLNNMPTDEIWSSHEDYDTSLFTSFKNAAAAQDLAITQTEPGTVFEENGLKITVVGPLYENDSYVDLNDTSLVLMVEFGELKFLFTGDMEAFAENQLVQAGVDLDADVLKVGHHGSYSSTSQSFLSKVTPQYGIISCGYQNEYGHPHNEPLKQLERANVEIYRTDLMGSILLFTDGSSINFSIEKPAAAALAANVSPTPPKMPTVDMSANDDFDATGIGAVIGVCLAGALVVAVVVVIIVKKRK